MEDLIQTALKKIIVPRHPELISVRVIKMYNGFNEPFHQVNYTTSEEVVNPTKRNIIDETESIFRMFDLEKNKTFSYMPEIMVKFKLSND